MNANTTAAYRTFLVNNGANNTNLDRKPMQRH